MENLVITRFDAQKFARRAYEAGFNFIGGCCGFEPYHIRALAEEVNRYVNDVNIAITTYEHCKIFIFLFFSISFC